jgi:hypothetical protein
MSFFSAKTRRDIQIQSLEPKLQIDLVKNFVKLSLELPFMVET